MNDLAGMVNPGEFMKDVESVNKLQSATTKLFPSGPDSENFLPDIKDVT
jgi:hypothetical protein